MAVQQILHMGVVLCLFKMKADPLLTVADPRPARWTVPLTAADTTRIYGTSAEHVDFMERHTHCANPACAGQGLKTRNRCKRMRTVA